MKIRAVTIDLAGRVRRIHEIDLRADDAAMLALGRWFSDVIEHHQIESRGIQSLLQVQEWDVTGT